MGLGYWLTEQLIYDNTSGELLTDTPLSYWTPGVKDIPIDFRTTLWQRATNPSGILGSKGTGEPALCMAYSVIIALRQAINSARNDARLPSEWISFGTQFKYKKKNQCNVFFYRQWNNSRSNISCS